MTTVAVALIERGGRLLICRRRGDQQHAGKWEFPGGKLKTGEAPAEALLRELDEELSIEVTAYREVLRYDFAYPQRPAICLVFFAVGAYRGVIDGSQFAAVKWELPAALPAYDFLEGDGRIVEELAQGRHL